MLHSLCSPPKGYSRGVPFSVFFAQSPLFNARLEGRLSVLVLTHSVQPLSVGRAALQLSCSTI